MIIAGLGAHGFLTAPIGIVIFAVNLFIRTNLYIVFLSLTQTFDGLGSGRSADAGSLLCIGHVAVSAVSDLIAADIFRRVLHFYCKGFFRLC